MVTTYQIILIPTYHVNFVGSNRSTDHSLFDLGGGHDLMAVEDTVRLLTDLLNEKKVWIYDKEEHLLGMSKQLTAIISDWDTETHQMIEKLHKARDEQVRHIFE